MKLPNLCAACAIAATAGASDGALFYADIAVRTKYVWRGLAVTDSLVVQPTIGFERESLSFELWASVDSNGRLNELDAILSYTSTIGPASSTLSFSRYEFPNPREAGYWEATASIGLDGNVAPNVEIAFDTASSGLYARASLSSTLHEFLVCDSAVPLRIDGWMGWGSRNHNRYWYETAQSGFSDWGLEFSAPISLARGVLTPSILYTSRLQSGMGPNTGQRSNLVFGIAFAFDF